jgi:hypothetical protein
MEGWIGTTTRTFAEAPRIDKNINNMFFLYRRDNNIVDFATLKKIITSMHSQIFHHMGTIKYKTIIYHLNNTTLIVPTTTLVVRENILNYL